MRLLNQTAVIQDSSTYEAHPDLIGNSTTIFASKSLTSATDTIHLTNETYDVQLSPNRLIDHTIVLVLITISFYICLISILYYCKFANPTLKWTNLLCCVSACLLLFETSWFQLEVKSVFNSNVTCVIYSTVNVCLATSNRTIIYIVFWVRQRSFYRGFLAQSSSKKRINVMSNILLAAIVVFAFIQILTLSFIPIFGSKYGCKIGKASAFLQVFAPAVFFIIALFQVMLLIPVLYPVVKHIHAARTGNANGKLESVVIRLSACTSICLITDVAFLAVSINEPTGVSFSFIPICYAVNTVVNVLSMQASFADYNLRLCPFAHLRRSDLRNLPCAPCLGI